MSFNDSLQAMTQVVAAALGEPCTLTPKSGAIAVEFSGIFEIDAVDTLGGTFAARAATTKLLVPDSIQGQIGDSVTVRGKVYKLARVEPDAGSAVTWTLQS